MVVLRIIVDPFVDTILLIEDPEGYLHPDMECITEAIDPEEDIEYMYIIWASGSQSRLNLSYNYPCFSSILENFLNRRGNYESVPDDEYI